MRSATHHPNREAVEATRHKCLILACELLVSDLPSRMRISPAEARLNQGGAVIFIVDIATREDNRLSPMLRPSHYAGLQSAMDARLIECASIWEGSTLDDAFYRPDLRGR